jgi:hypothetical protein
MAREHREQPHSYDEKVKRLADGTKCNWRHYDPQWYAGSIRAKSRTPTL